MGHLLAGASSIPLIHSCTRRRKVLGTTPSHSPYSLMIAISVERREHWYRFDSIQATGCGICVVVLVGRIGFMAVSQPETVADARLESRRTTVAAQGGKRRGTGGEEGC